MNKKLIFLGIITLFFLAGTAAVVTAQDSALYGINAADRFPNGCIDCHNGSIEPVLNTDLKDMGHPDITNIVKSLPADCMMCHKEGAKAGPLGLITHKNHYMNASSNSFVTNYAGNCLACHTVDTATWQMSNKNGSKNW